MDENSHESGLITSFASPERQAHLHTLLRTERGRKKILFDLEQSFAFPELVQTPIKAVDQTVHGIRSLLRAHGAPLNCYVLSEHPDLNCGTFELKRALNSVLGFGYQTLISCLPGRLAYYEGEFQRRFVLLAKAKPDLITIKRKRN